MKCSIHYSLVLALLSSNCFVHIHPVGKNSFRILVGLFFGGDTDKTALLAVTSVIASYLPLLLLSELRRPWTLGP